MSDEVRFGCGCGECREKLAALEVSFRDLTVAFSDLKDKVFRLEYCVSIDSARGGIPGKFIK